MFKEVTLKNENSVKRNSEYLNGNNHLSKKAKLYDSSLSENFIISNCADRKSGMNVWAREPVNYKMDGSESINFQYFDMDTYVVDKKSEIRLFDGIIESKLTILRFFGVTEERNSVCLHVHSYEPYFFVNVPNGFKSGDVERFMNKLNMEMLKEGTNLTRTYTKNVHPVTNVDFVYKKNIFGFTPIEKTPYLKISVTQHRFISVAVKILLDGFICPGYQAERHFFKIFEANVNVTLRFLVDKGISGCSWLKLPSHKYSVRGKDCSGRKTSTCQIECDIDWHSLVSLGCEDEWSKIVQFRLLSFDIECSGRKGIFPEPQHDSVIQIANVVQNYGSTEHIIRNVFTFKKCAPLADASVYSYDKEEDMLEAWCKFFNIADADIITGYNIQNFDFPYLINRANALNIMTFPFLGRIMSQKSRIMDASIASKQMGRRENKTVSISGRVQYDLLLIIQRNYKLRSYTLNSVSYYFLQQQKEDVHYSIITDLQNESEFTRRRLAVYCLKDAKLPLLLIEKLTLLVNTIEMSRVTGIVIRDILNRGEQIKVFSQLIRKAHEKNLIIPTVKVAENADFEGATVIEPIRGYYEVPIATLDFSSLYPSIMIANNLCYTTLLTNEQIIKYNLTNDQYIKTPSGNYFATYSYHKGLLPNILETLLNTRKKIKGMLKDETDPFKKKVLDGRQLAIKLVANSVYGFTGAAVGKLPCLEISQSVTAFGRDMIDQTKSFMEKHFSILNGYEHDCVVIYGDTDSVMCKFGTKTVAESMKLGREAASIISEIFKKPIKLEFEKVYFPYLLINKKRYAGIYWTNPDTPDKMDCKGIETVRRDNCSLVSKVISKCLTMLLYDRNKEAAIAYVKHIISELLCNRVDLSQLIISKELRKTDKEYVAKQAHVELAAKLRKRDAGKAPKLGDRIPYVITSGTKKMAAYQRAEDPLYVLENNISIDTNYYLENQLAKPLLRIFEPILGDKAESILLHGDHTRHKHVSTAKNVGMAAYTVKKNCCMGCKSSLKNEVDYLCSHCEHLKPTLYIEKMAKLSKFEKKCSQLWSQCQRCQESMQQRVICSNIDCPIFFMRTKVIKDVEKITLDIKKFTM